jgi:hypothetical protein
MAFVRHASPLRLFQRDNLGLEIARAETALLARQQQPEPPEVACLAFEPGWIVGVDGNDTARVEGVPMNILLVIHMTGSPNSQ